MDNVVAEIPSDIGIDIAKHTEEADKKYDEELQRNLTYPEPEAPIESSPQLEEAEPAFTEVPLSTAEIKKRSELLSFIRSAKVHFPNEWIDMGISDSMIFESSIEQLEKIVTDYKFRRNSVHSFEYWYTLTNQLMLLAEGMGATFGLELQGFAKRLEQNKDYTEALKSVIHDQQHRANMSPVTRLGIAIVVTGFQVHTENTTKKIMEKDYNDI